MRQPSIISTYDTQEQAHACAKSLGPDYTTFMDFQQMPPKFHVILRPSRVHKHETMGLSIDAMGV